MEQILYGAPVAKQLDEISLKIFQEVKSNNKSPHNLLAQYGQKA